MVNTIETPKGSIFPPRRISFGRVSFQLAAKPEIIVANQTKTEMPSVIRKAWGWLSKGNRTFLPKRLAMIVGMLSTMVIEARNFMTLFKFFVHGFLLV